jgi:toxin secretion/phage lysis holin
MDISFITNIVSGTFATMLYVFLALKFLDFALGTLDAIKNKELKSGVIKQSILIFFAELIGLIFVAILDYGFGKSGVLNNVMALILIYNESISIVENLGRMGVPIPNVISKFIKDLNPDKDNTDTNTDDTKEV